MLHPRKGHLSIFIVKPKSVSNTEDKQRHGLVGHWYADIVAALIIATLLLEAIYHTFIGTLILGIEAEMLARILEWLGAKILFISSTTFIVFGYGNTLSIIIVPQCSGIYGAMAFTLIAFMMPHITLRRKIYALIIYAPLVLFANIERMLITIIVGLQYGVKAFQYTHSYIASIAVIIVFTILWLDWFYRSFPSPPHMRSIEKTPHSYR